MRKQSYLMSLLLALVLSAGLASCGSSDEGSAPEPAQPVDINAILGTWICTFSTDVIGGASQQGLMLGKLVTLNSDGTYTSTYVGLGSSGSFTKTGANTITLTSVAGSFNVIVRVADNTMHWSGVAATGDSFEYDFKKDGT